MKIAITDDDKITLNDHPIGQLVKPDKDDPNALWTAEVIADTAEGKPQTITFRKRYADKEKMMEHVVSEGRIEALIQNHVVFSNKKANSTKGSKRANSTTPRKKATKKKATKK